MTELVVGVGTSSAATAAEVTALLDDALHTAGLDAANVVALVTIAKPDGGAAIDHLGWPVTLFPAEDLRTVAVPHPSPTVAGHADTPSVAEAAALLAAGPGGELVVPKQASAHATVAIARRGSVSVPRRS